MQDESFVEDINNLLNSGEVPNLFPQDERMSVRGRNPIACSPCLDVPPSSPNHTQSETHTHTPTHPHTNTTLSPHHFSKSHSISRTPHHPLAHQPP